MHLREKEEKRREEKRRELTFYIITISVFEHSINIVGMVIYATELVLWLGVFACGGAFNFVPWVKARTTKGSRQQQLQQHENEQQAHGHGHGHGHEIPIEGESEQISLHSMPSSTSVFRTASGSEVVERKAWARGHSPNPESEP